MLSLNTAMAWRKNRLSCLGLITMYSTFVQWSCLNTLACLHQRYKTRDMYIHVYLPPYCLLLLSFYVVSQGQPILARANWWGNYILPPPQKTCPVFCPKHFEPKTEMLNSGAGHAESYRGARPLPVVQALRGLHYTTASTQFHTLLAVDNCRTLWLYR